MQLNIGFVSMCAALHGTAWHVSKKEMFLTGFVDQSCWWCLRSLWRPFRITFWYFIWFEVPKITSGPQTFFLMIFELKILWFLMSSPFKSNVHTYVFMRFHFFRIFAILMTSGTCLVFSLMAFGGLWAPLWWFFGLLYRHWKFIDFPGSLLAPQNKITWWCGG